MTSIIKQIEAIKHLLVNGNRNNIIRALGTSITSPHTSENDTEINVTKKKKIIQVEMQLLKDAGEFFIPDRVPEKHWSDLLNAKTRNERFNLYRYLKKIEISSEKKKRILQENRVRYNQRIEARDASSHIIYGLRKNSMFMQVRPSAMNRFYNKNLMDAALFGPKIILDFGYVEHMKGREIKSCVKQIQHIYGANKVNRQPFDLHFCNLEPNSEFDRKLCNAVGTLRTSKCLVTTSEKSYLDIFPKEKLVYLTPDSHNELMNFNYDDIYVIGGIVDLGPRVPLTLAKAKKEGLRNAKLPLEKYLNWHQGKKAITLDQIFKILLTLKNTQSWSEAFQHIPTRKLGETIRM